MLVSARVLTWAMRLYPPFLFQRIWTKNFDRNYRGVSVKINHSLLNRNYNRSIFGGTLYSATDPFYVILFHQVLKRKGYNIKLWSRNATIDYIKPADCNLYFQIIIQEKDIDEAVQNLDEEGKFIKPFPVKITNRDGVLYAMVHTEIYIKRITPK
jgi:hypothetical protein